MRIILIVFLLSIINMTHAATINATIEANKHFYAGSMESIKNPFKFPHKHYESDTVSTNKIDSSDPIFGKFNQIVFNVYLDLISYNKESDTYKFKLTFLPEVRLSEKLKVVGRLDADVKLINNQQSIIEISGKFNRNLKDNEFPKSNMLDKNDFMLSVDSTNNLYITTQHAIPVIITTK